MTLYRSRNQKALTSTMLLWLPTQPVNAMCPVQRAV